MTLAKEFWLISSGVPLPSTRIVCARDHVRPDAIELTNKVNLNLASKRYFDNTRHMDEINAVNALSALAQTSRLQVFRLLVRNGPAGLAAGEIALKLAIPHNTLSTHLAILTRAGLLSSTRFGRSIVYRIDPDGIQRLLNHLVQDCCNGKPELCGPLLSSPPARPRTVAA